MSRKTTIPDCCDNVFFAGDTKIVKIAVEGLTDLVEYDAHFGIFSTFWDLRKDRTSGITTVDNNIFIRLESADTVGQFGEWNYRVWLTSSGGEVATVAYGILRLN